MDIKAKEQSGCKKPTNGINSEVNQYKNNLDKNKIPVTLGDPKGPSSPAPQITLVCISLTLES
jgi:hypothetical protein